MARPLRYSEERVPCSIGLPRSGYDQLRAQAKRSGCDLSSLVVVRLGLASGAVESDHNSGFYAGIITALHLLNMHGQDTIYDELVELLDLDQLVAHAAANDELAFAGLIQRGYADGDGRVLRGESVVA